MSITVDKPGKPVGVGKTTNDVYYLPPPPTPSPSRSPASQPFFIPAKERPQTYDANGNLTSDGVFTYEWDADGARPRGDGTTLSCPKDESGRVPSGRTLSQDRLVTIEHTTSQPKFRKKFRYDYMSRRVEERYFLKDADDKWEVDPDEARKRGDGAPEACPKGRAGRVPFGRTKRQYTRRYIYDGYTMVAELDVFATGYITTRRTFAWGHETAGGGIGALLLVEDHPNDRGYYPGYDGRGSVTLLVDADTGEKVAGMDVARQRGDSQASLARRAKATGCPLGGRLRQYDVWGKLVRATGEWRATPFLYDTKWSLDEGAEGAYSHWPIGLYDYGFRMYQPATGRFISRDPVREEGGLNLYQAFAGDPVNRTDFLGLLDEGLLEQGWSIVSYVTIGDCMQWGGYWNPTVGDLGDCYFAPPTHNDSVADFQVSLDFQMNPGNSTSPPPTSTVSLEFQTEPPSFGTGFEAETVSLGFQTDLNFNDRGSFSDTGGSGTSRLDRIKNWFSGILGEQAPLRRINNWFDANPENAYVSPELLDLLARPTLLGSSSRAPWSGIRFEEPLSRRLLRGAQSTVWEGIGGPSGGVHPSMDGTYANSPQLPRGVQGGAAFLDLANSGISGYQYAQGNLSTFLFIYSNYDDGHWYVEPVPEAARPWGTGSCDKRKWAGAGVFPGSGKITREDNKRGR